MMGMEMLLCQSIVLLTAVCERKTWKMTVKITQRLYAFNKVHRIIKVINRNKITNSEVLRRAKLWSFLQETVTERGWRELQISDCQKIKYPRQLHNLCHKMEREREGNLRRYNMPPSKKI